MFFWVAVVSQVQIAGYAEFPETEDWEKYTDTDALPINRVRMSVNQKQEIKVSILFPSLQNPTRVQ